MNAITYSHARENLAATITNVCTNHDPVIITKKGTDAVVMISLEDFESDERNNLPVAQPEECEATHRLY